MSLGVLVSVLIWIKLPGPGPRVLVPLKTICHLTMPVLRLMEKGPCLGWDNQVRRVMVCGSWERR